MTGDANSLAAICHEDPPHGEQKTRVREMMGNRGCTNGNEYDAFSPRARRLLSWRRGALPRNGLRGSE
jgi:hypothetical protein